MKAKICKVTFDNASRDGVFCQCCDRKIKVGSKHIKSATPKRITGYHLHKDCHHNFKRKWARVHNTESGSVSLTCRKHRVMVYSSLDDAMYFIGENGMNGRKVNQYVARYTTDWKTNRQSIGSVLSTCFKHGCRVFVQFDENRKLIEVFSKAEYTELTNINK